MDGRNYFFVILIVLFVILLGSIPFLRSKNSSELSQTAETTNATSTSEELVIPKPPEVHVYAKGKRTLVVTWDHLPEGTARLNVFRSLIGKNDWVKWKTIDITSASGNVTLTGTTNENLNGYQYYVQAVSIVTTTNASTTGGSSGSTTTEIVLWTSTTAPPQEYPTSTVPTSNPGSGGSQSSSTGETGGSTPTSTPPGTPSSIPSSTTSGPDTPSSSSQVIYYTPNGQISGTTNPQSEPFWVSHVNKNIEIGWQNIPSEATLAIVYRSSSSNGPWNELLRQNNPLSSYSIRLVDDTLHQAHYYKLEARNASETLATYGPVFLGALE